MVKRLSAKLALRDVVGDGNGDKFDTTLLAIGLPTRQNLHSSELA